MTSPRQPDWTAEQADLLGTSGLLQRSRTFAKPVYLTIIIALAALSFGLAAGALVLTPHGATASIWWPAAGTSALLALLYRGPLWHVLLLVAAIGAISHVAVGRSPEFTLWAVIIVVTEIVVLIKVLGPQGSSALLGHTRGLLRFTVACVASATVVGLIGAAAFAVALGADPMVTFFALVPSHLSALLLIVPLALFPLPRRPDARQLELVLQLTLTVLVAALIFSPFQSAAIGALLFPFLGWAAVRFRPLIPTIELIVLGGVASVFTVLGGGPFGSPDTGAVATVLLQTYLLSIALTIQFITVVRSERAVLSADNERRAALLSRGFARSQVGSVFVRPNPVEGVSIVEINEVAASLVDQAWFENLLKAWLGSEFDDLSTEVKLDDDRTIQVHGQRVTTPDGDSVLALQLVDITAYVSAQEVMAQAVEHERQLVEKLHALAQQKDDFVSAVSHELRTPITSIVGFAEDLHEAATDDQREATTIIVRNALRLTEMVEDLLELGRMTTPNPVRDKSSIDLSGIARDAVNDQSVSARTRGVTLSTEFSDHPALVFSDANSLGGIATNLISNAIKFTPEGGTVLVTTEVDTSGVTLIVDDSGPGISDADEQRVFERFFRSGDPERRQTPGTGLGLSIVKTLVELLQGRVDISESPLGGARLTVTLPRTAEPVSRA